MSSHPGAQLHIPAPPSLVVHSDSDDDINQNKRHSLIDINIQDEDEVEVEVEVESIAIQRQLNHDAALYNASTPNLLFPPSATASSSSLSLPTMGLEDEAGDSSAAAPKNPFNFQTQVISTGPVKSVCGCSLAQVGFYTAGANALLEHWTTPRSPIQAQ